MTKIRVFSKHYHLPVLYHTYLLTTNFTKKPKCSAVLNSRIINSLVSTSMHRRIFCAPWFHEIFLQLNFFVLTHFAVSSQAWSQFCFYLFTLLCNLLVFHLELKKEAARCRFNIKLVNTQRKAQTDFHAQAA